MKVLRTLLGLIFDDGRLASVLLFSILLAGGLSLLHQSLAAAVVMWVGLPASLWISIENQLRKNAK